MNGDDMQRPGPGFERHAQTGLTVLVVALLCWVGLTTQNTQVEVAKIVVKVSSLEAAAKVPDARVDDLTRRVEALEAAARP
jgi:hypothetical protein